MCVSLFSMIDLACGNRLGRTLGKFWVERLRCRTSTSVGTDAGRGSSEHQGFGGRHEERQPYDARAPAGGLSRRTFMEMV